MDTSLSKGSVSDECDFGPDFKRAVPLYYDHVLSLLEKAQDDLEDEEPSEFLFFH